MQVKLTGAVNIDELKSEIEDKLNTLVNNGIEQYLKENLPELLESHIKHNPIEPITVNKKRYAQSSIITDDTGKSLSILNWSIETGLSILTIINRKRKEWSDNDAIHTPFHYHKISENI